MVTTYDNFAEFADAVAAHQQANPNWIRLNGLPFTIERTESQDCLVPITAVLNELIRLDETYKKNKYLYIYAPHAK